MYQHIDRCYCRYIAIILAAMVLTILIYGTTMWYITYPTTCYIQDFRYNRDCQYRFITTESINCTLPTTVKISHKYGGQRLCLMFEQYSKPIKLPCTVKSLIKWSQCPQTLIQLDAPSFAYPIPIDLSATLTTPQLCVLIGLVLIVPVIFCVGVVFAPHTPHIPPHRPQYVQNRVAMEA